MRGRSQSNSCGCRCVPTEHQCLYGEARRVSRKKLIQPDSQHQTLTYEKLYSIAVGQIGIRPCDFEDMTFAEYCWAAYGWNRMQIQKQRQEWEIGRWQTWILTSIQLEKKDRKPMNEMFPLPWDKDNTPIPSPQLTLEQRRQRAFNMLNQNG